MSSSKVESGLLQKVQEHADALRTLSSREFEQLIMAILVDFGWEIQPVGQGNGSGCDFRAVSNVGHGLQVTWFVQCKFMQPSHAIGVEEVRNLYGAKMAVDASNAMLATTGDFTQGARDFAESRSDLHLADSMQIAAWLQESKRRSGDNNVRCIPMSDYLHALGKDGLCVIPTHEILEIHAVWAVESGGKLWSCTRGFKDKKTGNVAKFYAFRLITKSKQEYYASREALRSILPEEEMAILTGEKPIEEENGPLGFHMLPKIKERTSL